MLDLAFVKQFRDDFKSSVSAQSVMLRHFLFDRSEVAINGIGGVWDIKFGIFLIGEKEGQIGF